jgi:hypothetical protein
MARSRCVERRTKWRCLHRRVGVAGVIGVPGRCAFEFDRRLLQHNKCIMKATEWISSLAAFLVLGFLPQPGYSQGSQSGSPSPPVVRQLVPGERVAGVARAPSSRVISVQHVERVNLTGLGGKLFSTGLDEVFVRIVPVQRVSWKREQPYRSEIYLLAPGEKRLLGSNFDDCVVRLGRLPAGEIKLGIDSPEGSFQTGPGHRNRDNLPHAKVTGLRSGVVEVRFEDLHGLPEQKWLASGSAFERAFAHRNFLSDVIVQFSGGVTADAAVMQLLECLKDPNPDVRNVAAYALKVAHPQIARSAGIR